MSWHPDVHAWSVNETLTVWRLNTEWTDRIRSLRRLNDHAVCLSLSEDQTISVDQNTPIRWDVVDSQVGSEIWTESQPTRLLVPVPGFYALSAMSEWQNASGGWRALAARISDHAPDFDLAVVTDANGGHGPNLCGGGVFPMTSTNDYLEVIVRQNVANDDFYLTGGGPDKTHCSWRLIGAST